MNKLYNPRSHDKIVLYKGHHVFATDNINYSEPFHYRGNKLNPNEMSSDYAMQQFSLYMRSLNSFIISL